MGIIETGGTLAGVVVGGGGVLLALRWMLLPNLQRIHTRLDNLEEKLDHAREAGTEEHRVLGERLATVEEGIRGVQRAVNPKRGN